MSSSWALSPEEQEKIVQQFTSVNVKGENKLEKISSATEKSDTDDDQETITAAEKSFLQKIIRKGLVENKNDIEIQRKDPNSPLFHAKSFEDLNLRPELLKGLYDMGYNAPSKIQETTLPAILAEPPMNLIAQSQSGTGKTAAFTLAMLSRVDVSKHYPQVLCLSPTYELAIQTGEVASRMAKFLPQIEFSFAVRGEEKGKNETITEHVIIGTPGKVVDWALKFKYFDPKKLTVFVLDEADIMISTQGHHDQVHRIRKALNPKCQMLLFSATYEENVMEFAEKIIPNALILRLKREDESLDNIKQCYIVCENESAKSEALFNLYSVMTVGQAIIFCQTRREANWLAQELVKHGFPVALLSAELTVDQRIAVLDRYRDGKERVLITTNVLSRGIDIEQVNVVVNFQLPVDKFGRADCETYLHRIGRTGRFGKQGVAINLIQSTKDSDVLKSIEHHFGKPIRKLDVTDLDEIERTFED